MSTGGWIYILIVLVALVAAGISILSNFRAGSIYPTPERHLMTKINANLGDVCRDTVTGFQGLCIARTEWLNGCWRMTLQPQALDKDGKPMASETFDDFQLQVVTPKQLPEGSKETGGPRDAPRRAADPR